MRVPDFPTSRTDVKKLRGCRRVGKPIRRSQIGKPRDY